jgi:hypothetical protein
MYYNYYALMGCLIKLKGDLSDMHFINKNQCNVMIKRLTRRNLFRLNDSCTYETEEFYQNVGYFVQQVLDKGITTGPIKH